MDEVKGRTRMANVSKEIVEAFQRDGCVHIQSLLTEEEVNILKVRMMTSFGQY